MFWKKLGIDEFRVIMWKDRKWNYTFANGGSTKFNLPIGKEKEKALPFHTTCMDKVFPIL